MMKILSVFVLLLVFTLTAFAQITTAKGMEFYLSGDYDSAITTLQSVVQSDEKDRKAWLFLGMSLARNKKNKEAREAFRKASTFHTPDLDQYDVKLKILFKPKVEYTDAARQNQIADSVKLAVEFGEDGKIRFIFPVETAPYGMTESCIVAAKGIKFEPAQNNGKPVTIIQFVDYRFSTF